MNCMNDYKNQKLSISQYNLNNNRQNYLIGDFQRPQYRGYAFIIIMQNNLWHIICTLYLIISWLFLTITDAHFISFLFRFEMSIVYFGNCYVSLQYHCGDLIWDSQYRIQNMIQHQTHEEHIYLKLDLGLLVVLMQSVSTIWNDNYEWNGSLIWFVTFIHFACVILAFCVIWFQNMMSPNYIDNNAVISLRCIYVIQLFILSPYCLVFHGGIYSIIIGSGYFFAIMLYIFKIPKSLIFGYHEWFHFICVTCHFLNMIFDVVILYNNYINQ